MNKLSKRLLLTAIIFPAIFLGLFVFTFKSHLIFNLFIAVFAFNGAFEMTALLKKANCKVLPYSAPILSGLLPVVTYIDYAFFPGIQLLPYFLVFALSFLFLRVIFPITKIDFKDTINTLSSSVLILIYPGYFFTFMIKILSMDHPHWLFLLYLLIVFSNEIFAYLIGNFFGRSTRLNLPMSPNKSLVGFIGGGVASIFFPVIYYFIIPETLVESLWLFILICALVSTVAVFGDLIESAIKRSANIKDSGNSLAGRGGYLDSIDGLLLAAPVFYFLFQFIKG